ncbi:hypothetical protein [Halarchaeum acidiphilum]|uniref:hypothetical protein n=1 Tax=Halarchaeum acidiphilum TaxID=489138 RepID=UPI00036B1400|nr:hypothetical protein [Halarchaeum acidiphilum]
MLDVAAAVVAFVVIDPFSVVAFVAIDPFSVVAFVALIVVVPFSVVFAEPFAPPERAVEACDVVAVVAPSTRSTDESFGVVAFVGVPFAIDPVVIVLSSAVPFAVLSSPVPFAVALSSADAAAIRTSRTLVASPVVAVTVYAPGESPEAFSVAAQRPSASHVSTCVRRAAVPFVARSETSTFARSGSRFVTPDTVSVASLGIGAVAFAEPFAATVVICTSAARNWTPAAAPPDAIASAATTASTTTRSEAIREEVTFGGT